MPRVDYIYLNRCFCRAMKPPSGYRWGQPWPKASTSFRSLLLVAPHDPLPLLRQLEGRAPGVFTVDYLERGPEAWRLRLVRAAVA